MLFIAESWETTGLYRNNTVDTELVSSPSLVPTALRNNRALSIIAQGKDCSILLQEILMIEFLGDDNFFKLI